MYGETLTCYEDTFEGLQERPVDVVPPEGVQVGQLGEFDVTDDGAEVPRLEDGVGLHELLKLSLEQLGLVGEDIALQGALVVTVLCPHSKSNICQNQE